MCFLTFFTVYIENIVWSFWIERVKLNWVG